MLKLMPIPQVLHVKHTIPTTRRPTIVAGTCSPVDQRYITATPGVATSAMTENQTKIDIIGLHLQVECWYEQELPEACSPFPLQSKHNPVTSHF